ncbi:MAG: hypothetical protein Ct9H300mP1_26760 [Planctomycetaceae bacterium]|nr:MAG: hypothetical protein Ct9H300mP1_26760 [Planctomycetaceae bacterium]
MTRSSAVPATTCSPVVMATTRFPGPRGRRSRGGNGGDFLWGEADEERSRGRGSDTSGGSATKLDGKGGNDELTGNAGDDTLVGSNGNDTLKAPRVTRLEGPGNGSDSLNGGTGDDQLDGGAETTR